MKKNIFFAMIIALVSFALTSCGDKESEGLSRFTYYPILEMKGDAYITTPVGSTFNDPGCVALLNGEDVSDQIQISGSVNTSVVGFYKLGYTVVNSDGFPASATRTVAVVDKNNFASAYFGESQYGTRHYYNAPIAIKKNADGTYTIEDILGGFYCYGRYPTYLGQLDFFLDAVIKLNDDNTIDLVEYGDWYWGDDVPDFLDGLYDPATGTVSINLDFGSPFTVRLTK